MLGKYENIKLRPCGLIFTDIAGLSLILQGVTYLDVSELEVQCERQHVHERQRGGGQGAPREGVRRGDEVLLHHALQPWRALALVHAHPRDQLLMGTRVT